MPVWLKAPPELAVAEEVEGLTSCMLLQVMYLSLDVAEEVEEVADLTTCTLTLVNTLYLSPGGGL